jgi:RNA 3'-terminal phosphate cyclase (ATP)
MGPRISARLIRHGFYPAGGGRIEVDIQPAPLQAVELVDRGASLSVRGRAVVASLPQDIAEREIASVRKELDWPEDAFVVEQLPGDQGPGNILLLEATFAHHTEVSSGFGQLGVSAQSIGRKTGSRMAGYIRSGTFAGPYLADQLLLPMALAGGGAFTTVKPSQHALTAAVIIRRFLDRNIVFDARKGGVHCVEVR